MMISTYRNREITREGTPLPSPSSAPDDVTETADTTKPALMMRSALSPACMVSWLWVKSPINGPGYCQTDQGAKNHDDPAHEKDNAVYLPDSAFFSRPVIESDQRAHSLDESVRRQIQEGLQLVVDAKDQNIYSENAARIAFSAEIRRDGSARFSVAGIPME